MITVKTVTVVLRGISTLVLTALGPILLGLDLAGPDWMGGLDHGIADNDGADTQHDPP